MLGLVLEKGRRKVKKEYQMRFFAVLFFMISGVLFLWILSLTPTFIKVFSEHRLLKNTVAGVESENLLSEKEVIDEKFSDLQKKVNALDTSNYKSTDLIQEVINYQIRSVSLSSISFQDSNNGRVIVLQGISNNRESLSEFALELEKSEMFSQVDLPYSNFTKDSDIPFVLTIKLKPLENE